MQCAGGHLRCVNLLIKAGADVNLNPLTRDGLPAPLEEAAQRGYVQCLKTLVQAGAELDRKSPVPYRKFDTALMYASENGNVECVRILLQSGASVNAVDWVDGTALIKAVRNGHENCVNLLLKSGADTNANKKVLLRERKRHTARRVAIAISCYSRGMGGGVPHQNFFFQSEHVSSQI